MILRVFVPEIIYRLNLIAATKSYKIFGKIAKDNDGENVSVFIVDICESNKDETPALEIIGYISKEIKHIQYPSDYIKFEANEIKSVLQLATIHLPNYIPSSASIHTQIFLYDSKTFSDLSQRNESQQQCQRTDPLSQLLILINKSKNENISKQKHNSIDNRYDKSIRCRIITILLSLSTILQSKLSFLNSAFLRHFHFWAMNLDKLTGKGVYIWTIGLDVIAGILVMLLIWHISNADEYLMQLTMVGTIVNITFNVTYVLLSIQFIIKELQNLLDALKGSPVGLKLNVDLNNFFIDCFRYHVDLWSTFLVIISPLVKYLFAPLAIIGCLGLSFQLSMLADLLSVITLHAHCIYTYASIIHKIEINGLFGVWRVVSGRRKNILKDRIESFEYTNPQLYLSTIFFTALLFLLPTNLVYYVVFASLRFALQCITYLLTLAQRKLLSMPVFYIAKWCVGQHVSSDNFEVVFLDKVQHSSLDTSCVSLFLIKTMRSSFPTWIDVSMP